MATPRIGVWAAGPRDEAGAWREREAEGASLARSLNAAALVVTDRVHAPDGVPTHETGPIPPHAPGLLYRLVGLLWSAKRAAGALRRGPSRSIFDRLWLFLLLPVAVPVFLAAKLARRWPRLRAAWSWLVGMPPCVDIPAGAECDVWLVLSPATAFPFPDGVRAVWLFDGPAPDWAIDKVVALLESPRLNTLFAVKDARVLDHPGLAAQPTVRARHRKADGLPALQAALAEAAGLPDHLPAPTTHAAPRSRPARIHLFLPILYKGGVWEATRGLVAGLAEVNRRRKEADFSLAVVPDQAGLEELARIAPEVRQEWLTHQEYDGAGLPWSPSALNADCWFALVDRFFLPTPPPVPLGVMVYDVIQRFLPETFAWDFHRVWTPAARATLARASLVVTTNPVTRQHAALEYGLPEEQLALVPTAWEPSDRFAGLTPTPAATDAPDGFLLTLANLSPHKGLAVTLKAYAALKARLGGRGPGLVVSGIQTDQASPDYRGPGGPQPLRDLARDLGLVPHRDLWCLGFTSDAQLLGLLQRCGAVVNSAVHDNGSFSVIEAAYFGKPAISSRYEAAAALYARFGIPVAYYPVGDHAALGGLMHDALSQPALSDADLALRRAALADPRLGHRHFAERMYDLMLGLARGAAAPRVAEAA